MASSGNLAQMFAQSQQQAAGPNQPLNVSRNASHSKAVDAQDDQHFEDTTFQLKRTRSVGLLDEFIAPTRKLIEEDQIKQGGSFNDHNFGDDDDDDDDSNQFIENVDEVVNPAPQRKSVIYTYDEEDQDENEDEENNETYDNKNIDNDHTNDEIKSPSPSVTPDLYQPHDDNDIHYEPSRHVDYLSHNWKEADISKSWRYIVLKRKDVANSARLENASWRTWAQAKYHLKTISPEAVNWLKESDVTWLYGPLYKKPSDNFDIDTDTKKYGSDTESSTVNPATKKKKITKPLKKGPKPILKKRTLGEMLTQPLPHHTVHSPPIVEDDFDLISRKVNAQYSKGSVEPPVAKERSESPKPRRIHFNDRVEQCIALNYPDSEEEEYDAGSEYDDDNETDDEDNQDSDDSDDEGGFFLMVKSPSSAQLHAKEFNSLTDQDNDEDTDGTPNSRRPSKADSTASKGLSKIQTIELLPATTLKCGSDEEEDNFAMSHNTNTSRGYDYYYDYNSVVKGDDCGRFQIGTNDFESDDTPQHLEGVSLVDVPENIVLGSNVEILETPEHISSQHLPHVSPSPPQQQQDYTYNSYNSQPSQPSQAPSQTSQAPLARSNSAFNFNSDSDSDEEDEGITINRASSPLSSNSSIKNFGENINRVSQSPSYASLSDVAAQGYIAQNSKSVISEFGSPSGGAGSGSGSGSATDIQDIQKSVGELNIEDEPQQKDNKGFRSSFLNSWKKHS